MTLSPQTLMALLPLLRQALQTATAKAPNVINALQNGYDTGIMNDKFSRLYNNLAVDGVDRYTGIYALQSLNNEYNPDNVLPFPEESAYDAAEVFKKAPLSVTEQAMINADNAINNISDEDWYRDSALDNYIGDMQDSFYRDKVIDKYKSKYKK